MEFKKEVKLRAEMALGIYRVMMTTDMYRNDDKWAADRASDKANYIVDQAKEKSK